jgi:hypothetical protein
MLNKPFASLGNKRMISQIEINNLLNGITISSKTIDISRQS